MYGGMLLLDHPLLCTCICNFHKFLSKFERWGRSQHVLKLLTFLSLDVLTKKDRKHVKARFE